MIILTSCVAKVAPHIQDHFLADQNYQTILFIDTAAEPEVGKTDGDDWWLQADLQSLRDLGYQVDRWSLAGKSRDWIEHTIDQYDIVYMCGGNTIYLLQQLQTTDSFDLIIRKVRAGKPYIGTSAGSIIAGPKIPIYLEDSEGVTLDDYTGFNFTNVMIVPHWGQADFKDVYLNGRVQTAYNETEPPFLLLNDYSYVRVDFENNNLQIIDTNN